jgi:hypothetical protein
MGGCVGLAVFKYRGDKHEVCLWHVAGGFLDQRAREYQQVKDFVAPYCKIHVGFGPTHREPESRRRWLHSSEFEELKENSEIIPTNPDWGSPNAFVTCYHGCLTFTCDTLNQVSSNGGMLETVRR